MPSFNNFLKKEKPVSYTKILDNEEHIDFKDIRLMFDCFRKQNINFVEILFTDYFILNPRYEDLFKALIECREEIVRYNPHAAINCMAGMAYQKQKALTHPYPATMDKIEKFGYDPKQLHHIMRLHEFIYRYTHNDEKYENILISNLREYLTDVKMGVFNLEQARAYADYNVSAIDLIKDSYFKENPEVRKDRKIDELLDAVMENIIKRHFIDVLKMAGDI